MNWKDISSFSRSDLDKTPRTFELRIAGLQIVVTRHIHHNPNEWVLQCNPWFNCMVVGTGDIEVAKLSAVSLVKEKLSSIINQLS